MKSISIFKKSIATIVILLFVIFNATSQENMISVAGGYVLNNIEDVETDAGGWRINANYEFNPAEGKIAHGLTIGYVNTSASSSTAGQTSDYDLSSLPIYYAPKFFFGKGSFKGFLKGAAGIHFSTYKRTGTALEVTADDAGFYGGAGLGLMKSFKGSLFINFEYEWAYLSNSYYKDGFINSIILGVGLKF
jgi:hypothetical protein